MDEDGGCGTWEPEVYNLVSALEAIRRLRKLDYVDRLRVLQETSVLLCIIEVQQIELARSKKAVNLLQSVIELVPWTDIRDIMSRLHSFSTSPLHGLVRFGDKRSVASILEPLSVKQRMELLSVCDWRGNTLLHCAVFSLSQDAMEYLLNSVKSCNYSPIPSSDYGFDHAIPCSSSDTELEDLLLITNNTGCTFLHLAMEYGSVSLVRSIFSTLSDHHILLLLRSKNKLGMTCLHLAAQSQDSGVLLALLDRIVLQLCDWTSDFQEIIMAKNFMKDTFLHIFISHGPWHRVEAVLDLLPVDITSKMLSMVNVHNQTPLHRSVTSGQDVTTSGTSISVLLRFILDKVEETEQKKIILSMDCDGSTLLHRAAKHGSEYVVRDITAILPSRLTAQLALVRDKQGRTAADLTYGAKRDHIEKVMQPRKFVHDQTNLAHIVVICPDSDCAKMERRSCIKRSLPDDISYTIYDQMRYGFSKVLECSSSSLQLIRRSSASPSLSIQQLLDSMARVEGKIKVVIVHACQRNNDLSTGPTTMTPRDDSDFSEVDTGTKHYWSHSSRVGPPSSPCAVRCQYEQIKASFWPTECHVLTADECARLRSVLTSLMETSSQCEEGVLATTCPKKVFPSLTPASSSVYSHHISTQIKNLISGGAHSGPKLDSIMSAVELLRKLPPGDVLAILLHRNDKGNTLLHQACQCNDADTVSSILYLVAATDRLRLLSMRNDVGQTPVHALVSAWGATVNTAETIITNIFDNLSPLQKRDLLLIRDQRGKTILHAAAANNETSDDLLLILLEDLSDAEELLSLVDDDGFTVLHLAAEYGSDSRMQSLLSMLEYAVITRLMGVKDNTGQTPLSRSVRNIHSESVVLSMTEYLLKGAASGAENVLFSTDQDGCTFLHNIAMCDSHQIPTSFFSSLPPSILIRLLRVKDKKERTVLHLVAGNKLTGHQIMPVLLKLVAESYSQELESLLFSVDYQGSTLLHWAAKSGSEAVVKDIITLLPRRLVEKLASMKDEEGKEPVQRTEAYSLKRDYIHQAGSYPPQFYHLETAPKVLIFYTTKNRQPVDYPDGSKQDAEMEKDYVESYFRQMNFRYDVKKDPTAHEIYSIISTALADQSLPGLIVFVMTHGQNGLVSVNEGGGETFMMVEDIITHMCRMDGGKPKVLVIQACQASGEEQQITAASSLHMSRRDPVVGGCAMRRSVLLKRPDFLLFMAAATGSWALRNLMIPCLMESLRELRPSDCMTQAFTSTIAKIRQTEPDQVPLLQSTLQKRLCIGKAFPPVKQTNVGYSDDDVAYGDVAMATSE